MSYEEAIAYLFSILGQIRPENFGLSRMQALCDKLGSPERSFRVVHVAGTNGKGSTAAMIEAALRRSGCRTGFYSSPHLSRFNERFLIDGEPIDDAGFARAIDRVKRINEQLIAKGGPRRHPTMFESVTAAAFCAFEEAEIDVGVIEVGLGGRLDASNVVEPELCVITPIGLDHEAFLGKGMRSIAAEKAGIIKQGARAAVSAAQPPDALEVLARRSADCGVPFDSVGDSWRAVDLEPDRRGRFSFRVESDRERTASVQLGLPGEHQVSNAATALAAASVLGVFEHAVEALPNVRWPGRLEWLRDDLLIDAAHNPSGAATLRRYLERFCADRPIHLIYGSSRDKAVEEVAGQVFPFAERVTLTRSNVPRSVTPSVLASMLDHLHERLETADSVEQALESIRSGELTVVAGSIFLIGEARDLLLAH